DWLVQLHRAVDCRSPPDLQACHISQPLDRLDQFSSSISLSVKGNIGRAFFLIPCAGLMPRKYSRPTPRRGNSPKAPFPPSATFTDRKPAFVDQLPRSSQIEKVIFYL